MPHSSPTARRSAILVLAIALTSAPLTGCCADQPRSAAGDVIVGALAITGIVAAFICGHGECGCGGHSDYYHYNAPCSNPEPTYSVYTGR